MKKIVHPRAAKTSDVFEGNVYDITLTFLVYDFKEAVFID